MLLANPDGNKVLVQSQGNINLVIDAEPEGRWAWSRVRPTLPVLGAAVVLSCVVSSVLAVAITLEIRNSMEERLAAQIQELGTRVDTALSTVGASVVTQSDRVSAEVVRVGERVDRIPVKIDETARGTSNAVISWLASLRKGQDPVPLVVRANERRHK